MQRQILLSIFVLSSLLQTGESLNISGIQVPSSKVVGETAVLRCDYDLEGSMLYSVKWYKGVSEFYRFVPSTYPSISVFPTTGLIVHIDGSNGIEVTLRNLSTHATGTYVCEVSTDAPHFKTGYAKGRMTVLPIGMNVMEIPNTVVTITDEIDTSTSLPDKPANYTCTATDLNKLEIRILEEKLEQLKLQSLRAIEVYKKQEERTAKEHELQMTILELQRSYWSKKSQAPTN